MDEAARLRLAKIKADPQAIREEVRRIYNKAPGVPIWERDSVTQQTYHSLLDALEIHASVTEQQAPGRVGSRDHD